MDSELEGTVDRNDPNTVLEAHLVNPEPYVPPLSTDSSTFQAKLPFLTKYFCSHIANFFRLSNGVIQVLDVDPY